MTTAEITTALLGIASILLLALQVYLAGRTLREDHVRRRRQATLDYLIHNLRGHWKNEIIELTTSFADVAPMPEEVLERIISDPHLGRQIIRVLGNLEHMSVGVNLGVYDIELMDRASGAYLIRLFYQFQPYIDRKRPKQPKAYVDFPGNGIGALSPAWH